MTASAAAEALAGALEVALASVRGSGADMVDVGALRALKGDRGEDEADL